MAKRFQKKTISVDPLEGFEKSFLDGKNIKTVGHYKTPPSIHSCVLLYKHVPEFDDSIAWLNIWNDQHLDELQPYFQQIVNDTIIIAEFQTLKSLAERVGFGIYPLFHFEDRFAVRVMMS